MRYIVNIGNPGGSSDFGSISLVSAELRVDILCDMGKRVSSVLGPEEVLGVDIVRLLLQSTVLGRLRGQQKIVIGKGAAYLDGHTVELHV